VSPASREAAMRDGGEKSARGLPAALRPSKKPRNEDKETPMAEAFDLPKGELMRGKRGLVLGVANHQSIAWGISAQLAAQGAELAFGYMDMNEKRVKPLGESIGVKAYATFDALQEGSTPAMFETIAKTFPKLDFLIHALGFAERSQISGSFVDNAERGAFLRAMDASVFSFVEAVKCAAPMMERGGSIIAMTYLGSERAIPNYNTMGVCKAALEASVRYAARDLGPRGIRVNAISAGAVRTLSLAGIKDGRSMLSAGRTLSALREDTSIEGVAGCALWLLSDLGRSTTGEVVHVDAGFHMMGLPSEEEAAPAAAS
jgi:enoyl-[acyl-carrier protein] reductase I